MDDCINTVGRKDQVVLAKPTVIARPKQIEGRRVAAQHGWSKYRGLVVGNAHLGATVTGVTKAQEGNTTLARTRDNLWGIFEARPGTNHGVLGHYHTSWQFLFELHLSIVSPWAAVTMAS